jgi:hypothetical protein
MASKIWYEDPRGFMGSTEAAYSFIPLPNTPLAEQLNAIVRFALYYSIAVMIFCFSLKVLLIPILVAALTAAIYRLDSGRTRDAVEAVRVEGLAQEPQTQRLCRAPTPSNPFMNAPIGDANITAPCDITRPSVSAHAERLFADPGVYGNGGPDSMTRRDLFGRRTDSRQFFSVAAPNDQGAFANWLYNDRSISRSRKEQFQLPGTRGARAFACSDAP